MNESKENVQMRSSFSDHSFEYRSTAKKKLILSLTITIIVMIIELIGGLIVNSIALISDAGHMSTHSFAIMISLIAILIARKPPCHHKTFGLYRAEVLAAFINGLFLIIVVIVIIYEAILRIIYPQEINGFYMLLIAILGLTVNLLSIYILHGSHETDLNVRGVFYHMIADAASSIGIVIISIIILYTNWTILDPLVSFGISILIFYWAWGILKESTRILLEMAPKGMNIDIISNDLKNEFQEISEVFNVHFWTIAPEMAIFTAYILLNDKFQQKSNQESIDSKVNEFLSKKYKIIESTIQIASKDEFLACNIY